MAGTSRSGRRDVFRRAHREGQRVVARLRGYDEAGLALLEIDGQELRAAIDPETRVGARVALVIESLEPEIVLKQLPPEQAELSGPDPTQLIQAFRSARASLEALLAPLGELPASDREHRFTLLKAEMPELTRALAALEEQRATLTAQPELARIALAPLYPAVLWLWPGARQAEAVLRTHETRTLAGLTTSTTEGELWAVVRFEGEERRVRARYMLGSGADQRTGEPVPVLRYRVQSDFGEDVPAKVLEGLELTLVWLVGDEEHPLTPELLGAGTLSTSARSPLDALLATLIEAREAADKPHRSLDLRV